MKVKHLILLGLALIFASCDDTEDNKEYVYAYFNSRPVTEISLTPIATMNGNSIDSSDFYLQLKTSNESMQRLYYAWNYYGETYQSDYSNASSPLEEKIEDSYMSYMDDTYGNQVVTRTINQLIEYRTTGVQDLIITADQSFGGVAAGESVNSLFTIVEIFPEIIVNAATSEIAVDWRDVSNYPTTIDAWLSKEPLAQATMILKPVALITEIPEDISFTVTLSTNDGTKLQAESHEVYISAN